MNTYKPNQVSHLRVKISILNWKASLQTNRNTQKLQLRASPDGHTQSPAVRHGLEQWQTSSFSESGWAPFFKCDLTCYCMFVCMRSYWIHGDHRHNSSVSIAEIFMFFTELEVGTHGDQVETHENCLHKTNAMDPGELDGVFVHGYLRPLQPSRCSSQPPSARAPAKRLTNG